MKRGELERSKMINSWMRKEQDGKWGSEKGERWERIKMERIKMGKEEDEK
jgi:hypothetical protein